MKTLARVPLARASVFASKYEARRARLFSNADTVGNGANDGIAVRLRKFGDQVLGADGMLTTRTAGLNSSLASNKRDQDKLNDRLATTEARLRAQYSALDTKMATLNALSTYMTQQIAAWNKNTSSSSW